MRWNTAVWHPRCDDQIESSENGPVLGPLQRSSNQVAQRTVQEPEVARGTDLREYAPRKYSARETVVMTIKLFVVIGGVLGLLWAADLAFKN
jgi:hypothetical protein